MIHYGSVVWAQDVETITRTYNKGPFCEGEDFFLGFDDEHSCFQLRLGVCGSNMESTARDRSGDISVDGPGYIGSSIYFEYLAYDRKEPIKVLFFKFKAIRSVRIIITSRSPIYVDNLNHCPELRDGDYIWERIWIYNITVIQKPPTPTLSVVQYASPGSVSFIASGCPTSQEGFDYQWNSYYCESQKSEDFRTWKKDGTYEGSSSNSFRVRCSSNFGQCFSEPSDFKLGLSYTPPNPSCVPSEIKDNISKIDRIKKSDDPQTYHYYTTTNEICNTSDTKCSLSNVFRTMTSANKFISPIPSDLPTIPYGADEDYTSGSDPVRSCTVVDLPGLGEEYIGEVNDLIIQMASQRISPLPNNYNNPIMTYIDYNSYSTLNYTLDDHIFSPGKVIRQVVEKCGKIYIVTIGEGLSDKEYFADRVLPWINKNNGENIFNKVDARLKEEYIQR